MAEPLIKPMGLEINREQAALLLRGLKLLPEQEQKNVICQSMTRDLETIVSLWDRVIKNQKAAHELKKAKLSAQKVPKVSAPLQASVPQKA